MADLLPPPPAGDEAAAAAMGRESEPMDEPGWPQPLCLRRRGSELGDQELEMEFVHAVAAVDGGTGERRGFGDGRSGCGVWLRC